MYFFEPEFQNAVSSLRILGGYVFILSIGEVARQALISLRMEVQYAGIVTVSGLLGLILYWAFIPNWDAAGASLGILISHGVAIFTFCIFAFKAVSKS